MLAEELKLRDQDDVILHALFSRGLFLQTSGAAINNGASHERLRSWVHQQWRNDIIEAQEKTFSLRWHSLGRISKLKR